MVSCDCRAAQYCWNAQLEIRTGLRGCVQGKIRKPKQGSVGRDIGVAKSHIFPGYLGTIPERIHLKCKKNRRNRVEERVAV